MIENIGKAIENAVYKQYYRAKKQDKETDGVCVKRKVEVITKLVSQHIIKGNEIKLVATPKTPKKDVKEDTLVRELIMYSEAGLASLESL